MYVAVAKWLTGNLVFVIDYGSSASHIVSLLVSPSHVRHIEFLAPITMASEDAMATATEDWADTKALLEHDLLTGRIPLESSPGFMPRDIKLLRDEYKVMDNKLWTSRLYSARQRHRKHEKQAVDHSAALERSRAIYPKKSHNPRGEPRWEGSAVAAVLKQDVADGKHIGVSKTQFRESRPEYTELTVSQRLFRGRVYQEEKTQKFHAQWNQANSRGGHR